MSLLRSQKKMSNKEGIHEWHIHQEANATKFMWFSGQCVYASCSDYNIFNVLSGQNGDK